MTEAERRRFAESSIRAARSQAISTLVLCSAVAAYEAYRHDPLAVAFAALVYAMILAFKLRVIRDARAALASGQVLQFVETQKRSHEKRGRFFLYTAPFVVVGTFALVLVAKHGKLSAVEWAVQISTTAFIAYFWFWWRRALKRVARW